MKSVAHQRVSSARSLLFVPGHRPDRFGKAEASDAGLVVLDLEDAVGPDDKDQARESIRRWLDEGGEAVVRINGVGTPWYEDDVRMVRGRAAAIMVPKAEHRADLDELANSAGNPVLIPLIETAVGVEQAAQVCRATGVARPAFGSIDLAAQLGVDANSHDALRYARSAVVLAAAAAGCTPPIDGVTTALTDPQALRADIAHAVALGFTAKLCIHPSQVDAVNREFLPSEDEISWARATLGAVSAGAVTVHAGHMIDRPVLLRAESILARVDRP